MGSRRRPSYNSIQNISSAFSTNQVEDTMTFAEVNSLFVYNTHTICCTYNKYT